MWNRVLATVSLAFCRPLSGSSRETVETDTLQRRPRAATWPEKTGFCTRVFSSVNSRVPARSHFPTTWWWCDWHDDVVDMMVRQLAMRTVRNSEVSKLNFLWWYCIICKVVCLYRFAVPLAFLHQLRSNRSLLGGLCDASEWHGNRVWHDDSLVLGMEWGNGMIINSYYWYSSFPHSLLSTSNINSQRNCVHQTCQKIDPDGINVKMAATGGPRRSERYLCKWDYLGNGLSVKDRHGPNPMPLGHFKSTLEGTSEVLQGFRIFCASGRAEIFMIQLLFGRRADEVRWRARQLLQTI